MRIVPGAPITSHQDLLTEIHAVVKLTSFEQKRETRLHIDLVEGRRDTS